MMEPQRIRLTCCEPHSGRTHATSSAQGTKSPGLFMVVPPSFVGTSLTRHGLARRSAHDTGGTGEARGMDDRVGCGG